MKQKPAKAIKTISKVVSIQVAPAKRESGKNAVVNQMKHIILAETAVGINRTYLLKYTRSIQLCFYMCGVLMTSATLYSIMANNIQTSPPITIIRYASCAEYITLVLISLLAKRSSMHKIFDDIANFDEALNIQSDLNITQPASRLLFWVSVFVTYSIFEIILFITHAEYGLMYFLAYVTFLTHDWEMVYYCSIIRGILMRVRVLKAHVTKAYSSETDAGRKVKLNKIEALSNKVRLDATSMHKIYELLHNCADQLNLVMSLPLIVMLFYSGLSTTMVLKSLFKTLQIGKGDTETGVTILYTTLRCFKYAMLVITPCYYSSVTTAQVSHMRTMLHDAMNSATIGKIDRRRLKAFFQLTRENEFAYALWGVFRLNMSLPLSYLSLCTTYLVIIIQFSKFID